MQFSNKNKLTKVAPTGQCCLSPANLQKLFIERHKHPSYQISAISPTFLQAVIDESVPLAGQPGLLQVVGHWRGARRGGFQRQALVGVQHGRPGRQNWQQIIRQQDAKVAGWSAEGFASGPRLRVRGGRDWRE